MSKRRPRPFYHIVKLGTRSFGGVVGEEGSFEVSMEGCFGHEKVGDGRIHFGEYVDDLGDQGVIMPELGVEEDGELLEVVVVRAPVVSHAVHHLLCDPDGRHHRLGVDAEHPPKVDVEDLSRRQHHDVLQVTVGETQQARDHGPEGHGADEAGPHDAADVPLHGCANEPVLQRLLRAVLLLLRDIRQRLCAGHKLQKPRVAGDGDDAVGDGVLPLLEEGAGVVAAGGQGAAELADLGPQDVGEERDGEENQLVLADVLELVAQQHVAVLLAEVHRQDDGPGLGGLDGHAVEEK